MPNGRGKCWEEFKGWLKAFTPLETFLTIVEAVLLVVLIVFIVFLILHFLSCSVKDQREKPIPKPTSTPLDDNCVEDEDPHKCRLDIITNTTVQSPSRTTSKTTSKTTRPTCTYTLEMSGDEGESSLGTDATALTNGTTATTVAAYYDDTSVTATLPYDEGTTRTDAPDHVQGLPPLTDGVLADEDEKRVVLALVKIKPSGVTFGCILTVVSERWAITAASCLDSIEEVDSLDNFVIIDNYDEPNKGRSHAVTDVRVHPLFEGRNKSYDLALLRSDDELGREPVRLPSLLDYFKLTVGQAVKILGFGPYRTIDSQNKRVHSATIHVLPLKHCTPPDTVERHLVPLTSVVHARCGLGPVCGGVLYARGTPCNYCAGAPMLRARTLLGVMADHEQCGAACEPALHANIAAVRDWVDRVIAD